eukprot:gene32812-43859_t
MTFRLFAALLVLLALGGCSMTGITAPNTTETSSPREVPVVDSVPLDGRVISDINIALCQAKSTDTPHTTDEALRALRVAAAQKGATGIANVTSSVVSVPTVNCFSMAQATGIAYVDLGAIVSPHVDFDRLGSAMKSCLIVDDSSVVRKVARRILEDIDYIVDEAEDGQEAFDKCRQEMPDAILLDWQMPVMGGLEFLKLLRAYVGGGAPYVVFCVTENDIGQIALAMKAGASDYMMKPFDRDILESNGLSSPGPGPPGLGHRCCHICEEHAAEDPRTSVVPSTPPRAPELTQHVMGGNQQKAPDFRPGPFGPPQQWTEISGDARLGEDFALVGLAQHVAATPDGLDVVLAARGDRQLLAELADEDVDDLEFGLVHAAIEMIEEHFLGQRRALAQR